MSKPRVARVARAASVDVWPRVFGSPEFASPSAKEQAVRERERLIVLTRVGLRPGNHVDVLEMLGLIPTVAGKQVNA